MRVLTFVGFELQTARDLRVLLGKLRPALPQVGKFTFVISKQFLAHYSPRTLYSPLCNWSTVSNVTGSGVGSTCKRASTRKRNARSAPLTGSSVTFTPFKRGSKIPIVFSSSRRKRVCSSGLSTLIAEKSGRPYANNDLFSSFKPAGTPVANCRVFNKYSRSRRTACFNWRKLLARDAAGSCEISGS